MEKLQKQPYEQFTIAMSFVKVLGDGESIVGQSVMVSTAAGADVSDTMIVPASVGNDGAGAVVVLLKDGDPADTPHKITARCETSLGHRWEHDIQLRVVEL